MKKDLMSSLMGKIGVSFNDAKKNKEQQEI